MPAGLDAAAFAPRRFRKTKQYREEDTMSRAAFLQLRHLKHAVRYSASMKCLWVNLDGAQNTRIRKQVKHNRATFQ